ncbi:MAG: reverse transcriptase domain-containing protein [Oscillospiraceae bacterium]|nr:reverse transcriptase domain-containing protein [Oscillospiraceae bacterium]
MKIKEMLFDGDIAVFLENEIEKEKQRRRYSMLSEEVEYPSVPDLLEKARAFCEGEYKPALPECVQIQKLGSDKKRVIYVYPLADRLILKSVHYCLARTDIGLSPSCLAFRPGFSIHGAFRSVIQRYRPEYTCIRIDIKNYFNSIPIEQMTCILKAALPDEPDLAASLARMLRKTEVLEKGRVICDDSKGVMAGMPLSPLLANLYLTEFDRMAEGWALVYARYSDDMIFFCAPEKADALWQKIETELGKRGLLRNEEKSAIVPPGQSWEFIGLSYRDGRVGLSFGSVRKMKGKISRAARKLYRWKIRKEASTERAVRALIRKFQFKFYGSGAEDDELTWSRWYFPLISDAEDLREIDAYMQEMIRYLDSGRHTKKNYKNLPYEELRRMGYVPLAAAFYGLRKPGTEPLKGGKEAIHRSPSKCPPGRKSKE